MDNNYKMEYAQRQYKLMNDQLILFKEGKMNLASLIKNIKALLSILEEIDKRWISKIRSEWLTLEAEYAVALYQKEQGITSTIQTSINIPSNRALIDEAIQNMLHLVQERIYKNEGDHFRVNE